MSCSASKATRSTRAIASYESPCFAELLFGFEFQAAFVLLEKLTETVGGTEKTYPLFVVERHWKSAKAVDTDATLFTDFEFETAAFLRTSLFLEFGNPGHQFISS